MSILWHEDNYTKIIEKPLAILKVGTEDMGNGVYKLRAGTPLNSSGVVANTGNAKYLVAEDFFFYSNTPTQAKNVKLIETGYVDIDLAEEAFGKNYTDAAKAALKAEGIIWSDEVEGIVKTVDELTQTVDDLSDAVFADESWSSIKALVDHGKAAEVLPVGTHIEDKWEKTAGVSYEAPWDVVHHHENGDMELNWHYALADGIPFDEPEAIYFAPEGGLAAGQYYIDVGSAYGDGWTTAKHINFTLTAAMAEDDQLFIDCGKNNANDPANGRTWNVYAKGSTTSKQSGTTSNSTSGTKLGTIGATNPHKPEGNINAISRVVYGYGRWSQSAIRQWLNSADAEGAWWTPQNGWDRPSSVHSSLRGFLAGCSTDFIDNLQAVDVVTALNTQEGFADNTETTQDKIYLPCLENWYINPQYAGEGAEWDYYKALAEEAGLTGKFQQYQTYEILKKYQVSAKTSAVYVWLRSCYRYYANYAWLVYGSGYVNGTYSAYTALRGCPACKIKKST